MEYFHVEWLHGNQIRGLPFFAKYGTKLTLAGDEACEVPYDRVRHTHWINVLNTSVKDTRTHDKPSEAAHTYMTSAKFFPSWYGWPHTTTLKRERLPDVYHYIFHIFQLDVDCRRRSTVPFLYHPYIYCFLCQAVILFYLRCFIIGKTPFRSARPGATSQADLR